ncbi:MAG: hypothetical protein Q9175_007226, partial [Cornicularia normoerica]
RGHVFSFSPHPCPTARAMELSPPNLINEKLHLRIDITSTSDNDSSNEAAQEQRKGSTRQDVYDMSRMGKQQELLRTFRFVSIIGFVMVLQST